MSEREKAELKQLLSEVFEERVEPKLLGFEQKLSGALRRRNLALITAILCLVAAAFSAGYALNSRNQLRDQIDTNAAVVCSTARSTALAFREPQISADGTKETKEHFLERMLAQRAILLAAGHLECPSLPGFETFPYLRAKALLEIQRILYELDPSRFHKPHRRVPSLGAGSVPEGSSGQNSPLAPGSATTGTQPGSSGPAATAPGPGGGTAPSPPHHEGGGHEGGGSEEGSPNPPPSTQGPSGGSGGDQDEEGEEAAAAGGLVDPEGPLGVVCRLDPVLGLRVCG